MKPYKNNPRHNELAVPKVAESIRQFGFKVPIVIDSNNEIIAGHTRYSASKLLGLQKVPCIIADDLTEEQVRAFRLADNKVGEIAEWDLDLLNIELDAINNIDMADFGFELDDMEEAEKEIEEDDFDVDAEVPTISKRGDIWKLGRHRLMCGDSTSEDDTIRLLGGGEG